MQFGKNWKNAPLISLWWLRIWRKDFWVCYLDSLSSNPLDLLDRYATTCKQIKDQYGSSKIFTAKNLGTGLSVESGTETCTSSAEFRICFALMVRVGAD